MSWVSLLPATRERLYSPYQCIRSAETAGFGNDRVRHRSDQGTHRDPRLHLSVEPDPGRPEPPRYPYRRGPTGQDQPLEALFFRETCDHLGQRREHRSAGSASLLRRVNDGARTSCERISHRSYSLFRHACLSRFNWEGHMTVRPDQPSHLLPRDAAQTPDNHKQRANPVCSHVCISRGRSGVDAPQRERESGRTGPEYSGGVGHGPYERLEVYVAVRIGDYAFVRLQRPADAPGVGELLDGKHADRRERVGEQTRDVGIPNGGLRIVRHLGLVDGNAVHALGPADRGTPGGRKRGSEDDALTTRATQGRGELRGDVSPQGGIQLLVDDARFSRRARRFEDTLRGVA